jgi:GNAT superfamily N-acetyltransferase
MRIEGHRVRRVTAEDAPTVQALFELDPEYFERDEGAPLRPGEALEVLIEAPPGVPIERKHNFIVESPALRPPPRRSGAPGVEVPDLEPTVLLSLLEGFPDERTWFLGLIFAAPAARGAGLGTRVIEALCAHIREHGGTALRLGVIDANPGARRLYERLGFAFVVRKPRKNWNGTITELDVLERRLA